MEQEQSPHNILKPFPEPGTEIYTVYDTFECYDDEENLVNKILSLGFEPYAVTFAEIDMRDEAKAKMKLHQVPIYRIKRWFRRKRERSAEETALIREIPT